MYSLKGRGDGTLGSVEGLSCASTQYLADDNGVAFLIHPNGTLYPPRFVECGGAGVSAERLIEESFRLLLEREPKESILRSFALPVIETYFPEYRAELQRRLRP